jgi:protein-S-isoprenylcysteine O-methyltransferase Ste14
MYLGISGGLGGAIIASNCAHHLVLPLVNAAIMDWYCIPVEEKQLNKKFGEEYRKYKAKVRRWL